MRVWWRNTHRYFIEHFSKFHQNHGDARGWVGAESRNRGDIVSEWFLRICCIIISIWFIDFAQTSLMHSDKIIITRSALSLVCFWSRPFVYLLLVAWLCYQSDHWYCSKKLVTANQVLCCTVCLDPTSAMSNSSYHNCSIIQNESYFLKNILLRYLD